MDNDAHRPSQRWPPYQRSPRRCSYTWGKWQGNVANNAAVKMFNQLLFIQARIEKGGGGGGLGIYETFTNMEPSE